MGGFIVFKYNALRLQTRLTALALFSVVILGSAGDKYWAQMETIVSDTDYNHTQETGRLHIWSRGIGYMVRNPVLGVGPGNFAAAEGMLSPLAERQQFGVGVRWNAPHNIFIQVAAELGVPGLVLFTGLMASAFLSLHRSDRSSRAAGESAPVAPELIQALTASLVAFVVGGLFLSLAYAEFPYMLIALAVAVEKLRSMGVEHERARPRAS
jgi:O-antigen ligase